MSTNQLLKNILKSCGAGKVVSLFAWDYDPYSSVEDPDDWSISKDEIDPRDAGGPISFADPNIRKWDSRDFYFVLNDDNSLEILDFDNNDLGIKLKLGFEERSGVIKEASKNHAAFNIVFSNQEIFDDTADPWKLLLTTNLVFCQHKNIKFCETEDDFRILYALEQRRDSVGLTKWAVNSVRSMNISSATGSRSYEVTELGIKFAIFKAYIVPAIQNAFQREINFDGKLTDPVKIRKATVAVGNINLLKVMETWLYDPENIKIMFDKYEEVMGVPKFNNMRLNDGNSLYNIFEHAKVILDNEPVGTKFPNFFNFLYKPSDTPYKNLVDSHDNGFNPTQIIYDLGFKDSAEKTSQGLKADNPAQLAASLATSANGLFGGLFSLNTELETGEAPSTLSLKEREQCYLVSGLLYPNDTRWDEYWNIMVGSDDEAKSISPLSPKFKEGFEGHNRIYPVTNEFDSRSFMNKAFVGEETKDIFPLIAEDIGNNKGQGHDEIHKQLWWVFDDPDNEGVLREIQLNLSSYETNQKRAQTSSALKRALRILNNDNLSVAEKTLRVQELNLEKTVIRNKKPVKVKIPARENAIFAALQELQELEYSAQKSKASRSSANGYYYLEQMTIDFKGTNPSTARNDVEVGMEFNLSSLRALGLPMHEGSLTRKVNGVNQEYQVKLYDLITLPNTEALSKGFGSDDSTQYNPQYSRVRLKIKAKGDSESNLIIDLNTIDYNFTRAGATGVTSMSVSMRGFFESMLSLPENDIMTNPQQREARDKKQSEIDAAIREKNSLGDDATDAQRDEAKAIIDGKKKELKDLLNRQLPDGSSIVKKLSDLSLIHGYEISNRASTQFNLLVPIIDQNFVKNAAYKNSSNKTKFFFLGDLLYVLLDVLYKEAEAELMPRLKQLNMRYIISSIKIPRTQDGAYDELTINPACIPISYDFFIEWFNAIVIKKNPTNYRVGIFIRDLLERLINKIIYETCFTSEQTLMLPPKIRNTFVATTDADWYVKDDNGFLNPDKPFNSDDKKGFLSRNILDVNEDNSALGRKIRSKNYCLIYPAYIQAIKGISQIANVPEADTLKKQPYTPNLFYGTEMVDYNFLSNVSFSKNTGDFLREARYSNTNYGSLSLLSNVYDLSFSFQSKGANTVLYPGVVINFILLDWNYDGGESNPYEYLKEVGGDYSKAFGDSNPHDNTKIAHLLGFGGYFIITAVKYILGQTIQDFEIQVTCKFNGMDNAKALKSTDLDAKKDKKGDESKGKGEIKDNGGPPPEDTGADGKEAKGDDTDTGKSETPTTPPDSVKITTAQLNVLNTNKDNLMKLSFTGTTGIFFSDGSATETSLEKATGNELQYSSESQKAQMGSTLAEMLGDHNDSFITTIAINLEADGDTTTANAYLYYNSKTGTVTLKGRKAGE